MKTNHTLLFLLLAAALMSEVAMAQMPQSSTTRNLYFEDFESIPAYSDPEMSGGYLPMLWFYTTKTGTSHYYWPKVCSHSSGNYQIPTNSTLSLGDRSLYMASSSSSEVGDTYAIWNGYGCVVTSISFNSWREANKGTLYLGYVTDPDDVTTFHSLQTLTPPVYTNANANNATFTYTFNNIEIPYGAYPTFHWHQANESTVRSVYLDNVSINCVLPQNHIANTASDTQITWAQFAAMVNGGCTYEGQTVYLDEDITASTEVGLYSFEELSFDNSFQGTFDGQGHTITFNYGTSSAPNNQYFFAPFHSVKDATFQNLRVTGTIYTNHNYTAGFVGLSHGSNTFTNCESNITINANSSEIYDCGGFVGRMYGNTYFDGCAFTGRFLGSNAYGWDGFVGDNSSIPDDAETQLNNCVFAPTAITLNLNYCYTFVDYFQYYDSMVNLTNCYYTQTFGVEQGKQCYTITAESPITAELYGTATNYNVSHITAYSGTPGLLYNGTVIAGEGDQVSLNLSGGASFNASYGTLTGSANPYTLYMSANNTTITGIPIPPYNTDFESTCDWTFVNGSCTNQWCWGTAASNGGTHGLYISNNGGTTNAYTTNSSAMVYAYKTFYFEAGIYDISYDWKTYGESIWDFLRVALVPASVSLEASTSMPSGFSTTTLPEGWIALDEGSKLNLSTDWQNKRCYFTVIETTGEYKMVFAWRNDSSEGINPPAAIDNVSIEAIPCATPYNLTASNTGTTTADLSWLGGVDVESYTIEYRPIAYFRPIYIEGFEYGIEDWTLRDCASNTGISTTAAYTGDAGFCFYNSTTPQYLISPELTGIDQAMSVYFHVRNNGAGDFHEGLFYFGYSTTDNETESFTFEGSYSPNGSMINLLMSIPADTKYVCWKYASDNCQLYIDDISIGYNVPDGEWLTVSVAGGPIHMSTTLTGLIPETPYQAQASSDCTTGSSSLLAYFTTLPTCVTPTDLTVGNVSATTANLSWTGGPDVDSYTVKYRTSSTATVFSEGFEDGTIPSGWTQSGPGTWNVTQGYGYNSIGTHSGTYNVRINHNGTGNETFLITPMLDLSGQNNLILNFWYINFIWSPDIDQLYVYYRVDQGEWIELWSTTEDHQEWTESGAIMLPNLSANYQIGFKMIDKWGRGVGIDDITISSAIPTSAWQTATVEGNATEVNTTLTSLMPETTYEAYAYPDCDPNKKSEIVNFRTGETCPIPNNFTVDSLTSTTADLTWTAMPEVENYTVEYRLYHHFSPIYSEGFEYGINDWTLRNCTGDTGLTTEDAFSGNFAFFFDNNGTTQYLISPELTGIDEEMTLRLYGRHCGHENVEAVYVGFSATDTDNASFNFVEEGIGAFGEWDFRSISVPAGTKYICFKRSEDNGCPLFLDDISIGLDVPDGEWHYINVEGGFFQGNVTLTGLIPETPYQSRVYNDCAAGSSRYLYFTTLEACVTPTNLIVGDVSATTANLNWTGGPETESYTVKYRTSNIVLIEGFEDGLGDWTLRDCHASSGIITSSNAAHSGNAVFRFNYNTNPPQYLISPELTGVAERMKLEFYYKNASSNYPEAFQVGFSATDNATASFTFGNEITASDMQWHLYSGTVPAGTKYICWKLNSYDQYYLYIDDIMVGTEGNNTSGWQTATVEGNANEVNATLTGLTPETTYEAYVYPNCDPNKKSEIVNFTTGECPIPNNFTVDSLTSTTADLTWTAWPDVENYTVEYRLYHHFSPIFSEGFEHGIDHWTLRNCTGNTGLTTEDAFSGNFAFFFDNNGTTQYLISPELTGIDEEMALRLYGRHCGHNGTESVYVGFSATNTDNASFNFVEVEIGVFGEWDFHIISVPAGTKYICFKRSEDNGCPLFIDDISIGLNIPDGEWQTVSAAGGTYQGHVTLTGLIPETYYQAQVYNDCSAGSSFLLYFTTLEACVTPTDLTVSDVSATTANLSWTGGPETESYTVKYKTLPHINPVFSEGFEDGTMPQGWTQSGPGTWNVTQGYGYNGIGTHSGTYNARITHNNRESETFLISPMLDLSGQNDLFLNFWYINYNWGFPDIDQLYVYYRVNEGDWIELWSTTEEHQVWTESGAITLPNPSANYQIGFKMIDKYGRGVGIDDIAISSMVFAGEWQTATITGNTTEVSNTLTGLTPSTSYEAYVYPNCNPNKKSEIVSFTTEMGSVFSTAIAGYGNTDGNWHLIASPVTNISPYNVEGMTDGDYDLYRFSPSDVDLEWRNYEAEDVSFNLEAGKGYLYARSTDATLTFVGTPYSGNGEFELVYDANDDHKCWNLVGNPFDGEAYLDRQYYVMKADGTGINPVAVPATTPIPPFTAVFVKATAAGQTVVFTRVAP